MHASDGLTALADPTRRRVYKVVVRAPSSVGEIASQLPVSRPAVSQHLRVLLDADLVSVKQVGSRRIYRAERAGLDELRDWFESLWSDALDAFEAAAQKEHEMRSSQAAIAPITKVRRVAIPVDEAFELFTLRMGDWWPLATHSIAGEAVIALRFEGRVGGRVIEVADDGSEYSWAEVRAWNPPHRFVLSWHPTRVPDAASTLEVLFAPTADGGTELTVHHRGWEEFGAEGEKLRGQYDPGWDFVLQALEDAVGQ